MADIIARIHLFNKGRLADMLPYKYELMGESLFRFFRGTCHIFYEDFKDPCAGDVPLCWITGDLHLENFGSYKAGNGLVYFDLNDFDEALLAPLTWELARTVSSIFVACASLKIEEKKAMNLSKLFLKTYKEQLLKGKASYIEPRTARGIVRSFLKAVSSRSENRLLKKKTVLHKGKLEILMDSPKHLHLEPALKKALVLHINTWIKYNNGRPYNYAVKDVAFRIAGTSSLGLKRYVFLLEHQNPAKGYLLLEMKEAAASCLGGKATCAQPAWKSEAERITIIQQLLQNISPSLLGTTVFKKQSYLIQEMQPVSDSIDFNLLKKNYREMCEVIQDMALLTASSQLRSSGRLGSATADELVAFAGKPGWEEALLAWAHGYTQQVQKDYNNFIAAKKPLKRVKEATNHK